jgi:predicted DNA-binding protein (UPF0251 family)
MSKSRSKGIDPKLTKIVLQCQNINSKLNEVGKKLDTLIVIELAKAGLSLSEAAETMGVSEDTIERMIPFRKLKPKSGKE